eukprot:scaffold139465_cov48-Prasinocladus_malaysianus.AAC.1
MLKKALSKEGIDFRPESYKWSLIQALLSRGDRRLTQLLLKVREHGDSAGAFKRAFKEMEGTIPPMEFYVHRTDMPGDSVLPWSHLEGPLSLDTLKQHAERAAVLM